MSCRGRDCTKVGSSFLDSDQEGEDFDSRDGITKALDSDLEAFLLAESNLDYFLSPVNSTGHLHLDESEPLSGEIFDDHVPSRPGANGNDNSADNNAEFSPEEDINGLHRRLENCASGFDHESSDDESSDESSSDESSSDESSSDESSYDESSSDESSSDESSSDESSSDESSSDESSSDESSSDESSSDESSSNESSSDGSFSKGSSSNESSSDESSSNESSSEEDIEDHGQVSQSDSCYRPESSPGKSIDEHPRVAGDSDLNTDAEFLPGEIINDDVPSQSGADGNCDDTDYNDLESSLEDIVEFLRQVDDYRRRILLDISVPEEDVDEVLRQFDHCRSRLHHHGESSSRQEIPADVLHPRRANDQHFEFELSSDEERFFNDPRPYDIVDDGSFDL